MPKSNWYKGNIHTHTTESDGDDTPEKVVDWYQRHGYDFLVLSDHNHLTLLNYNKEMRPLKRPLMVPGEEVSATISGGSVPIHINGIGISRVVEPIVADDIVATLQANVNAIVEAGGIASINHPNFRWAFDHKAIIKVTGASLLEVYNGHPKTNIYGCPGRPGNDEIWDAVLTAGKPIFGVATDDSHNYHDWSPTQSNPGRGWIVVRAESLSTDSIVDALATGDFYASTGITLADLDVFHGQISLSIKPDQDTEFTTVFTARHGRLLHEVTGITAKYDVRGDEGYIRATIRDTNGKKAWIQPVFTATH